MVGDDYAFSSEIKLQISRSNTSNSKWYEEYERFKELAKKIEERENEIETYLPKIHGLGSGKVATVKDGLSNAKSAFNGGGYVSDGEGLCSSEIETELSKMDNLGEKIDNCIDLAQEVFDKLYNNRIKCESYRDNAFDNYKYYNQKYMDAQANQNWELARIYE